MAKKKKADYSHLPYRSCVGIMLLNKKGRVWVGRRSQKWIRDITPKVWQMPQGGIDRGEDPVKAALRELHEETGVKSVEVLAEIDHWLFYDLPEEALGIALRGKYRGQKQKWFAMRFTGKNREIRIDGHGGHKPEFDDWKWVKVKMLPRLVVPFKRGVYQRVVNQLGYLADTL